MPTLTEFLRDPVAAYRRQFEHYRVQALQCLADARATDGIGRRCCLRSARHFGKMARLTLNAGRAQEVAA